MERHDVVIVGAGPAGLSAAARLRQRGVKDIVVLEREAEAGGIPRHCGHWGFGWESHRRLMTGPHYAARLRHEAEGIDLRTRASVLAFESPHVMRVHTSRGISDIEANRVILATGARESSRAARFVGGGRNAGIINTGTLQQLIYLKGVKPFQRPVILGGEWVSFSALMTCRHAGIRPAAMIVEEERIDAPWFFALGARWRYGVFVRTSTRIVSIEGAGCVECVVTECLGKRETIACDGVIVSGRFVSEDTLFAEGPMAALKHRQNAAAGLHRDSLAHVSLVGNVQGPLKTAGRCAYEARALAEILEDANT